MMVAESATPFAGTTAGYITGILTPVAAALIGALWIAVGKRFKQIEQTLTQQNEASATQSQALAIVVTQINPLQERITAAEGSLTDLGKATAVLQYAVNEHRQWHDHKKEGT